MSRDIVRSCVPGHRGQVGVSGLHGRTAVTGSVPAAAMGGLGVLRDGRAAGVTGGDRGGVPGDGDRFALTSIAGAKLAGENTDLAAPGYRSNGCSDTPCRRVVASALHGCTPRGARPIVEAGHCRSRVVDDVLAVIVEDLEAPLVPQDVHVLAGPTGGDIEDAAERLDLPVLFDFQVGLALAGVQCRRCSASGVRNVVDAVDAGSR